MAQAQVHELLRATGQFETFARDSKLSEQFEETLAALELTRQDVVDESGGLDGRCKRQRSALETAERRAVQKRITYLQGCREDLGAKLAEIEGKKVSRFIQNA